ncbi:NAD(P)-dependent oxidoreductase [Methanoregula sp.]|uniref:SDR family oxidoreductase n=1 Tax=Methanoregula sp. TaxID=2052170 RepID=UPI003568C6A8
MKKILITGANGFLGSNFTRFFVDSKKYSVILTSQKCPEIAKDDDLPFHSGNLLDESFLESLLRQEKPDVIINTVSLVNVDLCEEKPDLARQITVQTAKNLAVAAKKYRTRLLYISTDQVFDGKNRMYTEEDVPNPINQYGQTKLEAERVTRHHLPEAVIIRTNFFGWSPAGHVPTFGEWVYNSLKSGKPMHLFTNFFFTPIEVTYLSEAIDTIIPAGFSGLVNITGTDRCSKYEFGIALADICGFDPSPIEPVEMSPVSLRAKRPEDMSLSNKKYENTFHARLPTLHESLIRFRDSAGHT